MKAFDVPTCAAELFSALRTRTVVEPLTVRYPGISVDDAYRVSLEGKAIIILNPAEPPLIMRDTVHCLTEEAPDQARITQSVLAMVAEVQKYVAGYALKNGPVFDGERVSVFLEVAGLGDYLPKYAGNLDIMTAAALRTAEMIAGEIAGGRFDPRPGAA